MPTLRTWFITGISSGFGQALAHELLAAGHRVIGTARTESALQAHASLAPGRATAYLLDVTEEVAVQRVVAQAIREHGPIDVVVNNAGYGHEGTIEEASLDDLKRQFDVNVFGMVAVIRAMLPHLRERRQGHIINFSSMGGLITFPGLGLYHASKFAVEGITETLAKEVRPFGIHVTAVEPGSFRTDFAGRSMMRVPGTIADYAATMDPIRATRRARDGTQPGDPRKAARAILSLVESPHPPGHLLLGADALKLVEEKLALLRSEFDAWRSVTLSTDHDV